MNATNDWGLWEDQWRGAAASPKEIDGMIARTARVRRALMFVRAVSLAVAAGSLGLVAVALLHAGNAFEAGLGLVVGAGITVAWFIGARNARESGRQVEANRAAYLAAEQRLCAGRLRFVRLARIVVALDLLFLIPWWIGGTRVHGTALTVAQVETVWAPLAVMIAFTAWTFGERARVAALLVQLGRVSDAADRE